MSETFFYFALQYSAIQKTVLRHDRLWSIAGMSQILSWLNEIKLPQITRAYQGTILVAGGGKFTARFASKDAAALAKKEIEKTIATALPMLEFQLSELKDAGNLPEAKRKGLIRGLNAQKRRFRGYGTTYNPHLRVCDECGEYPASERLYRGEAKDWVCRTCHQAFEAGIDLKSIQSKVKGLHPLTSIEKIYRRYVEHPSIKPAIPKSGDLPKIAADFENLFPSSTGSFQGQEDVSGERKRMAVWFSDLNNMNGKVPIWLSQQPDAEIPKIFRQIKKMHVKIVSEALVNVFREDTWITPEEKGKTSRYLPFRIIVAGGDDLCLVMPEAYILDFVCAISAQVRKAEKGIGEGDCLDPAWLEAERQKLGRKIPCGRYCFGAAFVVTPVHTAFKSIHRLGEALMSSAKKDSDRQANSVNWQILNVDDEEARKPATSPVQIKFEKPLFIDVAEPGEDGRSALPDHLPFSTYLKLRKIYKRYLSGSQIKNMASVLREFPHDPQVAEKHLVRAAAAGTEKGVQYLLADRDLRVGRQINGALVLPRVATLLELLNLKHRRDRE